MIFLLSLALAACSSSAPSPAATAAAVTPRVILPPASTSVPPPEPTQTTTITPAPPPPASLDADGPWLVSLVDDRVLVMNTDGSGIAPIDAPQLWLPYEDLLTSGIKATGVLALRTYGGHRPPADLSLTIFDLPSLLPIQSIPLLSPERQTEVENWPPTMHWWDDDDLLALDLDGFRPTLLWSPDGRYLAFVGLMDGLSAAVYAYDTRTATIRRLTDGPRQAILMGWSPDSRWVIHMEVDDLQMADGLKYFPTAVWAADVEGGPAKKVYDTEGRGNTEEIVGWRSNEVLVTSEVNVFGMGRNLKSADLNTGEFRMLFDALIYRAAVDPASGAIAFMPEADIFPRGYRSPAASSPPVVLPGRQEQVEGGIYLIPAGQTSPIRLEFPRWEYVYGHLGWIPEIGSFAAAGRETVLFTSAGEFGVTLAEEELPVASPDGSWLLFGVDRWGSPRGRLRVYTGEGVFVGEISDGASWHPHWSPDSSGVYYVMQRDGIWDWMYATVAERGTDLLQTRDGSSVLMMLVGAKD